MPSRWAVNLARQWASNVNATVPNGITAMLIACGQDVANVAEAAAGFNFSEVRDDGSYYVSITIPSLVVATYGGGTELPTQRECLEVLGCYGPDRVYAFAEIVAATVLCGELSLGSAIAADEWVSSHDAYGRNRPGEPPPPLSAGTRHSQYRSVE